MFTGVVSIDGSIYLLAGTNNEAFSNAYDLWFLKLSSVDKSVQNFTPCPNKHVLYFDKDMNGSGNNDYRQNPTGNICIAMPGYVDDNSDCDP